MAPWPDTWLHSALHRGLRRRAHVERYCSNSLEQRKGDDNKPEQRQTRGCTLPCSEEFVEEHRRLGMHHTMQRTASGGMRRTDRTRHELQERSRAENKHKDETMGDEKRKLPQSKAEERRLCCTCGIVRIIRVPHAQVVSLHERYLAYNWPSFPNCQASLIESFLISLNWHGRWVQ